MRKVIIYFILIVFAFVGCKKIDLNNVRSGDPVFYVDATLDGNQLNLVAGDIDFYMFSEFSKDNSDVYSLTGRFAKDVNCTFDCEESLSISIRSSYVTPNVSDFIIDEAIVTNSLSPYFSSNEMIEVQGFSYSFSGAIVDTFAVTSALFSWEITEGNGVVINYVGETIGHNYFGTEDLKVRLNIFDNATGCLSYFETTIPNGINASSFCKLFVENNYDSLGNLFWSPIFGNQMLNTFIWNGDSTINTPFEINPITLPNNVTLEAFNSDCNASMGICTFAQGAISPIFPQLEVNVQDTSRFEMINVGEQFSAVIVEYEDSTGTYSSEFADNSDTSVNTFTITDIEDYDQNENGDNTKKLTIEYECILGKEGSGETKNISGTAEIAVAYPG